MSADTARNSATVSPHADTALPPLHLRVDGLAAGEQENLRAILELLAVRLPRPWVRVDDGEADLYLHTHDARRSDVRARVTGLLIREDEPQGATDALWMPVPLRVMAVLDLLHDAQERLRQQLHAHPPHAAAQEPHPAANDEKTLASSLARLFVGAVEHSMRVRILGYGTLYVCPASGSYRTDFNLQRIGEALEAKRFILTAISSNSVELAATDDVAHPLDELLWTIGLMTPRERQQGDAPRLRLRSWPDFARLPHDPWHLQACAALSARPMNADELAAATGLDEVQADRFLHACDLCKLLETAVQAEPALPASATPASSLGGLFDRLWRRLVK